MVGWEEGKDEGRRAMRVKRSKYIAVGEGFK